MRTKSMRRYTLSLGMVCGLAACAPQPPLEVVTEQPNFANGTTQAPTVGPTPAPVTEPLVTTTPIAEPTETSDVVTADPFTEVVDQGGLTERLPNTCKLENYQYLVGQGASVLPTTGLDRAWRVVGPDTIVSQEYNPARLNFRTSGAGVIQRISCG